MSDTHFGAHDEKKCSAFVAMARQWRPDIVAVTGDIIDFPLSGKSYVETARVFFDSIRVFCDNIYIVPGNHDTLLGRYVRDRFWRKLRSGKTTFVDYIKIRNHGVCVIAVDTSHLHLPHLNNSGNFGKALELQLETDLCEIRRRPDVDWDRSIVIALVHHHPVPTITSKSESMLYFKNSGKFLSFAVRNGVRLVLHSHQHDPHFTKLSFGSDHDHEAMGVLSAGACFKVDKLAPEYSGCGHFYGVLVDEIRAHVTSFYYYKTANRFIPQREYQVTRVTHSGPRLLTLDQSLMVTRGGDMKVYEVRTYETTTTATDTAAINIGVDDESKEATIAELGLTVTLDGVPCGHTWSIDEPREKQFVVELIPRRLGVRLELKFNYTWPGGFQKLLAQKKDSGGFQFQSKKIEWYLVKLELEDTSLLLEPIAVYHSGSESVEKSETLGPIQKFRIKRPLGLVTWDAGIRTAPPP
jgi:UDP-2,3-diacylglucosamine pyrophosphatase LpxH